MIKDIHPPKVEGIAVAIVMDVNDANEKEWNVYLLNLKKQKIEGVLVTSTGYGIIENEKENIKTSTLRHFLDELPSNSFKKIEPIPENLFGLNNEYWVSFFVENVMYDKKFVFLAESIIEDFLTNIPLLNKKVVIIS